MEDQELTEKMIGCAMKVHSTLGPGFLESVYQKALAHELRKAGLKVEYEKPITVHYDGLAVGNFSADMLVDDRVMLELKAFHPVKSCSSCRPALPQSSQSFLHLLCSAKPHSFDRC